MKIEQKNTQPMPALLCNACGVDAQKTKSLCCEAAGIIDPVSATTEALIPHEKLREAASVDATLIARERPPAQPAVGYKPLSQRDERAEFEREFPVPEGLQYCANRDTYIRAAGTSPSNKFAREHYAYRAGFAAWMRRAWKPVSSHASASETERLQDDLGIYQTGYALLKEERDTLRAKLTKASQIGIEKSQEAKAYFALLKRITGSNNQDSLRAIAEATTLLANSEPCVHEFIPFTKSCSKCDEPYSTEQSAPKYQTCNGTCRVRVSGQGAAFGVTNRCWHCQPYGSTAHNEHAKPVTISCIRESMEESASSGGVAELQIGATHVRVTYHGIKWHHDRMRNGRWEPLAIEEFDEILCSTLKHEVSHD